MTRIDFPWMIWKAKHGHGRPFIFTFGWPWPFPVKLLSWPLLLIRPLSSIPFWRINGCSFEKNAQLKEHSRVYLVWIYLFNVHFMNAQSKTIFKETYPYRTTWHWEDKPLGSKQARRNFMCCQAVWLIQY